MAISPRGVEIRVVGEAQTPPPLQVICALPFPDGVAVQAEAERRGDRLADRAGAPCAVERAALGTDPRRTAPFSTERTASDGHRDADLPGAARQRGAALALAARATRRADGGCPYSRTSVRRKTTYRSRRRTR